MKFSERVRLAKDYDKWLKEFNESETDFQLKGCALTVITFLEEIGALKSPFTETVENRDAKEKHNRVYLKGKCGQKIIEISPQMTPNVGDILIFDGGRNAVVTGINHYVNAEETDYIAEIKE